MTTLAPRRVAAGAARLLRSAAADPPPRATTPPNPIITTPPVLLFFATAEPLAAAARQDARARRGAVRARAVGAATMEAMVQDILACRTQWLGAFPQALEGRGNSLAPTDVDVALRTSWAQIFFQKKRI